MKTTLTWLLTGIAGALLVSQPACEVNCEKTEPEAESLADGGVATTEQSSSGTTCIGKSMKKFLGPDVQDAADYAAGANVRIDSVNGRVDVVRGGADVSVTFEPFVFRAHDTEMSIVNGNLEKVNTAVTTDGSGNVTVSVGRASGARSTAGADITVRLPDGFDGVLDINQNNGFTGVDYVGLASSVDIDSDNGRVELDISQAPAALSVTADSSVSVSMTSIPAGATGSVTSNKFDVDLNLPGDGAFALDATAGQEIDLGSAPAGCTTSGADLSQSVTCNGGGATYTASAPGGLGSITVDYN